MVGSRLNADLGKNGEYDTSNGDGKKTSFSALLTCFEDTWERGVNFYQLQFQENRRVLLRIDHGSQETMF